MNLTATVLANPAMNDVLQASADYIRFQIIMQGIGTVIGVVAMVWILSNLNKN